MAGTRSTYANIVFSFQLAYAIGYVVFGRLIDKLGARFGYSLAATIWGIAAMAHAGANNADALHDRPLRARHRRIRQLPGRRQGRGRMVPEEGARLRRRHLQRRRQYRRDPDSADRAVPGDRGSAGAPPSSFTGALVFVWVAFWWTVYRRPREKKNLSPSRARLYRERPGRRARRRHMAAAAPPPPDLGLCDRQVHDRPDLVVLPVLAAELLRPGARPQPAHLRACRSPPSTSSPTSAASAAAGSRRR